MKYLKRFKFSIFAIIIVIIIFIAYFLKQKNQGIDCRSLTQKFDEYMVSSTLPIADSGSLCHGLYIGSNFEKLNPKWAVGKLIIESGNFMFKGINKTGDLSRLSKNMGNFSSEYENMYYKIDMNNWCRSFFSMAESRAPSPINRGGVKPIEVTCK